MGSVASPSMIAGVSPRRPRSLGATRPLYERRLRSVYTPQEIARPPRGQPGNRAGGVRNSAGDDRLKFGYKTPHPPGAPHTQSKAPLAPHRRARREFLEIGGPPETPLLGPHTGFAGKYTPSGRVAPVSTAMLLSRYSVTKQPKALFSQYPRLKSARK